MFQEALLKALQKVCIQMKLINILTTGTTSIPSPTTITSTILTQCRKKQNPAYQLVAMETIGSVVSVLEVDVFSEFSEIAFPILLPVSTCVCIHALLHHINFSHSQQPVIKESRQRRRRRRRKRGKQLHWDYCSEKRQLKLWGRHGPHVQRHKVGVCWL